MASRWARQGHGGVGGDAACKCGRSHHLPAFGAQPHFNHRDAVGVLRFQHLLGRHGFKAIGKQQTLVNVLVVVDQQAVGGTALQREKHQAIVVHAHLHGLLLGGVAGVGFVGGHVARDADRLAPGGQHRGHIVCGQLDVVTHADGHGFETHAAGFGLR